MTIKRTGKETDKAIRSRFELLREICEDARKVQILIYGNPDPDALASALSMKKILQAK
jgi:nanoRNase/pAp phosphatase (c-di-AMP/oligoRNAs hydrolase)